MGFTYFSSKCYLLVSMSIWICVCVLFIYCVFFLHCFWNTLYFLSFTLHLRSFGIYLHCKKSENEQYFLLMAFLTLLIRFKVVFHLLLVVHLQIKWNCSMYFCFFFENRKSCIRKKYKEKKCLNWCFSTKLIRINVFIVLYASLYFITFLWITSLTLANFFLGSHDIVVE